MGFVVLSIWVVTDFIDKWEVPVEFKNSLVVVPGLSVKLGLDSKCSSDGDWKLKSRQQQKMKRNVLLSINQLIIN